jgi:hypothetical protein
MKNKSTTYILLAGTLVIWFLIFYRVFAGINSEDIAKYELPIKKITQVPAEKQEEKFILLGNYRDPFLGATSMSLQNSTTSSGNSSSRSFGKIKKAEVKKDETIDWSFIHYIGIVNNRTTMKEVGLLAIAGKEYMVNEKDEINQVTIIKKERDSIL